jgi:hypothetical protein
MPTYLRRSALVFVLLVCGCSSWRDWHMQKSVEKDRARAVAQLDPEKCRSDGGTIESVGIFGHPICVRPYADAGKVCSDKSECLGRCLAPVGAALDSRMTGTCEKDDSNECSYIVGQGVVTVGNLCLEQ